MKLTKLKEPFFPDDIEWRIQKQGITNGKPWGMCVAYINNRAVQDRLDEVCGPENWQDEMTIHEKGVTCKISILIGGQWVTKEDGAPYTEFEAFKGGISDAEKRAAVKWGIGRYLYNLTAGWAVFCEEGKYTTKIENTIYKWNPPELPAWALPRTKYDIAVDELIIFVEENKKELGKAADTYTETFIREQAYKRSRTESKSELEVIQEMKNAMQAHIDAAKDAKTGESE